MKVGVYFPSMHFDDGVYYRESYAASAAFFVSVVLYPVKTVKDSLYILFGNRTLGFVGDLQSLFIF
jgi:hypothetical protein